MRIRLPGNESILMMLALAQTLGFGYAALMYEGGNGNPVLTVLAGVRGVLLGGALSFGAAVAAQRTPRIQSKRARQVGYLALGGLLVVSPVIMAPAIMAAMPEGMWKLLDVRWLWAVAISLAVAPDLVAVAVAAQSGALQADDASLRSRSGQGANDADAHADGAGKEASVKPTKAKAAAAVVFRCGSCERVFGSQNALNAHERAHKRIEVDRALLINGGR